MKTAWMLILSALTLACNTSAEPDGATLWQAPPGPLPTTPALEDCPGDAPCSVQTGHNYVAEYSVVEQHLRSVVAAGCQRFHGDCAHLCSSPWYQCHSSAQQCTTETVRDYLEDYDHPTIDAQLAAECMAQIGGAACSDIPPDTPACDLALVEGCPEDQDNLGAPYSWMSAARLDGTPRLLDVYLCGGVEEWLVLRLDEGDAVTVHGLGDEPSFARVSARLWRVPPGRDEPESLTSESLQWGDHRPALFDPVDVGGDYYLELRATGTVAFDLLVDVAPKASASSQDEL